MVASRMKEFESRVQAWGGALGASPGRYEQQMEVGSKGLGASGFKKS